MAYASASDVSALTRNLIGSASGYDTSTCPTLAQVNVWLSSGCALIESALASDGYGTISVTSQAYGLAQLCNALYAAWMAERSRISSRVAVDERTRADMVKKDFEYHLDLLRELDLSRMGVTQTGVPYAGGISVSAKNTRQNDTDRVNARFSRGQFRNPYSLDPRDSQTSAS